MTKNKTISIIIPVYNDEDTIGECLRSLSKQTVKPLEIIVVDDGSEDDSKLKIKNEKLKLKKQNLLLLEQKHQGPGIARNLGAKRAKGGILVFVDGDMTFESNFLEKLTRPIINGQTKGTFTKEEFVKNWNNVWARCWNYNQGIVDPRRVPASYPDKAPVFRAIIRPEFKRVNGFDPIGFTDDWTLSRKLGYQASSASGAVCYHYNPESLEEVYRQARWIGRNEFLTQTLYRRLINSLRFFPLLALIIGLFGVIIYREPYFFFFKVTYDSAIWLSVVFSFFRKEKYK